MIHRRELYYIYSNATLPINEIKMQTSVDDCLITNLHRCKNLILTFL